MKVNNRIDVMYKKRAMGVIECQDFSYDVVEVLRTRTIMLHAEVVDNGVSLGKVLYRNFYLKMYALQINKVVNGSVVDTIELITGLTHYSAVRAMRTLTQNKCDIDDIEPLFEMYGFPDLVEFNRVKIDAAKKYIRDVDIDLAAKIKGLGSIRLKEIDTVNIPAMALKEAAATN